MTDQLSVFTYHVSSLAEARCFLAGFTSPVIISNSPGSSRYYGMMVLDYIFQALRREFPHITGVVVNAEDDHAAYLTASKLGYCQIISKLQNF